MSQKFERINKQQIETLFAGMPIADLSPEAAARIEAICLTRLKRRIRWLPSRKSTLGTVLEATLALLLGGSYLLWNLWQAMVLYRISLP